MFFSSFEIPHPKTGIRDNTPRSRDCFQPLNTFNVIIEQILSQKKFYDLHEGDSLAINLKNKKNEQLIRI
jgi:hypothetical protein